MFNEHWAYASSDTLRNDPQGRVPSDVIFEAKGYKPRKQGDVYHPASWPHVWLEKYKKE